MINYEIIDKERNIAMLSFSTMQMPTFKVNAMGGWVDYGKKNDFPNQLLRLYEEHEEHGAIVGAKANYLLGEGIKAKDESQQPILDQFFSYANRYESWKDINDKVKVDAELFNCFYLQVITDLTGKPKEYYHLQYSNVRTSKCKTKIWYSENWLDSKEIKSDYCQYEPNSGKPGVYFIRFEFYRPTQNKLSGVYSTPQYIACVKSISTDIDISTFNNNYVANGFSAGTLVTFFQKEPDTKLAKDRLKEALLNTHSSPEKAGSIVLAWAGTDGKAPEISALSVDDLDKKFEFTSKRCLDKIIRGHNVTNPELFGVKTEGQLGTRVSLKESYELMLNTYTKPRQKKILSFYSDLIFMSTGQKIELEVEQLEPIGLDLVNDIDLTQDERRKLKGYEPLTAPKLDAAGQPVQQIEAEGNDVLNKLTRKQITNLFKTVDDFKKGRSTQAQSMILLKSFGLSESEALDFLDIQDQTPQPVKMSKVDSTDFIIAQFEAIENSTKDLKLELISEDSIHFNSQNEAMKFELAMELKFADVKKTSWLDRLISGLTGTITPTPKEIKSIAKEENPDVKTTQILTKYYYEVKPGAPALKTTSRKFCKEMMKLSKEKDGFTFEQIDSVRVAGLSNGFDEVSNIWDYRGGFYTNPDTGETDPFCRHYWKAKTYKVIN